MGFVNEYMTEEDIEKYKLFELIGEYELRVIDEEEKPSYRLYWVIDRERCLV